MKKTSWFLFILLFAVSCLDQPVCYQLNNNYIGIAFRVMGSNALDSVYLTDFIINESIRVDNVKEEGGRYSTLAAPLDYFNTGTSLRFSDGVTNRSLDLAYKREVQYVSDECGPRYILSELENSSSNFDSVRIVNAVPSRDEGGRHIEVFRCPSTDTMKLVFHQLDLPETSTTLTSKPVGMNIKSLTLNDAGIAKYNNSRKTTVRLPVDLEGESSTYVFHFDALDDSIYQFKLKYTKTTETRYRMCGDQTFVTELAIVDPLDESIAIPLDKSGNPVNTLTDPYTNNLIVYRCPPTNTIRIAFSREALIDGIKSDYFDKTYYAGQRLSTVDLPLNTAANSTTFTFSFEGRTETLIVDYASESLSDIFANHCKGKKRISNITLGGTLTGTVNGAEIVYPLTTNVTLELP